MERVAVILHAVNLHVSFICRGCSDQHHGVSHCVPVTILKIHWYDGIYLYIHTHTHMYIYIYTYIHIYVYMCVCIYIYIYTHTHTHTHTYIYIYILSCYNWSKSIDFVKIRTDFKCLVINSSLLTGQFPDFRTLFLRHPLLVWLQTTHYSSMFE